jgi:DNA-binding MarR family transcriptional regulator
LRATNYDLAMGGRSLSTDEERTWSIVIGTAQMLTEEVDRRLQRDAGMPHAYFLILGTLAREPDGRLRMSELANRLRYSQSRLTHAVDTLTRSGWVIRERSETDRRGQVAVLTEAGANALAAATPGHIAEIRRLLFNVTSDDQQQALRDICSLIMQSVVPTPVT